MTGQQTDPSDMEWWEEACAHCGWPGLSERACDCQKDLTPPHFAFPTGCAPDRPAA